MYQDATWYGGRPLLRRHCVRRGPICPSSKGAQPPIFAQCPLWPNGWMNQDATWYEGKPRPRRRCVRWGRSCPLKGAQPPVFCPCLLWPKGWMDEDTTWYGSRPRPRPHRPHCVRWGPSSPCERGTAPLPSFWPMSIVAMVAYLSYCWALVCSW